MKDFVFEENLILDFNECFKFKRSQRRKQLNDYVLKRKKLYGWEIDNRKII